MNLRFAHPDFTIVNDCSVMWTRVSYEGMVRLLRKLTQNVIKLVIVAEYMNIT